jgi:hypothetical protein
MDPQKLSQLDPKLREVYQRVMGTPASPPVAPTTEANKPVQTQNPLPSPPQNKLPANPQPIAEPQPQFTPPEPSSTIPIPKDSDFIQTYHQTPDLRQASTEDLPTPTIVSASAPTGPAPEASVMEKKSGSTKFIIFGLIVLVVIAVYTLFWTKIFSLSLPFLR